MWILWFRFCNNRSKLQELINEGFFNVVGIGSHQVWSAILRRSLIWTALETRIVRKALSMLLAAYLIQLPKSLEPRWRRKFEIALLLSVTQPQMSLPHYPLHQRMSCVTVFALCFPNTLNLPRSLLQFLQHRQMFHEAPLWNRGETQLYCCQKVNAVFL